MEEDRTTKVRKHPRQLQSGKRTNVIRHDRRLKPRSDEPISEKLKLEKNNELVAYREPYTAKPFGEEVGPIEYKCSDCVYFTAETRSCSRVKGDISPDAGCNLWVGVKAKKVKK